MTDATATGTARAPSHLWVVGSLALLWNAFGAFDYFMTRTKGAAWINQMMDGVDGQKYMAYIDGFPLWASIGWGLGVWGGLLGAVLLLMRKRLAVPVFLVSLFGAVVGIAYQLIHPVDMPEMTEGAAAMMPFVIIVIAAALWLYARAQAARGNLA